MIILPLYCCEQHQIYWKVHNDFNKGSWNMTNPNNANSKGKNPSKHFIDLNASSKFGCFSNMGCHLKNPHLFCYITHPKTVNFLVQGMLSRSFRPAWHPLIGIFWPNMREVTSCPSSSPWKLSSLPWNSRKLQYTKIFGCSFFNCAAMRVPVLKHSCIQAYFGNEWKWNRILLQD